MLYSDAAYYIDTFDLKVQNFGILYHCRNIHETKISVFHHFCSVNQS